MKINRCRVCNHKFNKQPLLKYKDMPGSAQFLPDENLLKKDKGITLEIYQCPGCGLIQLSNSPVPYYKEVIRATDVSQEMKIFRRKQFKSFVKRFSLKNKKIIEIGCGHGEYLSIMQEFCANVYGLEFSSKSVKKCKENGLNVSKGFVQAPSDKIKGAPFDAFFMLNFFEHLPNPNSTLTGIYNNLTEDAVGLIEVPNFDMIIKNKIFSEFIVDHLFYFTKDTLIMTLKLNGFEVIECNEIWHDYIISAIIKKRLPLDISHFYKISKKLKKEVALYIKQFKAIAVWGAGHQALTLISLLNLKKKIKYVIDSAPFKQGKYTAATHIPIVSPDTLRLKPVDSVLVMAASYSDEVVKIIKRNYSKRINIAVVKNFKLSIIRR